MPLSVSHVMIGFDGIWGFCGGWAIDLALGCRTRAHKDVDVALLRRDQAAFFQHIIQKGWTLGAVRGGRVSRWSGADLRPPVHEVWCRSGVGPLDSFEALLNESGGPDLLFRRDRTVLLPLADAFRVSPSGLPVLAPEVVLLYKAKQPDDETNRDDFRIALPSLNSAQRAWLRDALRVVYPAHDWLRLLRESTTNASASPHPSEPEYPGSSNSHTYRAAERPPTQDLRLD